MSIFSGILKVAGLGALAMTGIGALGSVIGGAAAGSGAAAAGASTIGGAAAAGGMGSLGASSIASGVGGMGALGEASLLAGTSAGLGEAAVAAAPLAGAKSGLLATVGSYGDKIAGGVDKAQAAKSVYDQFSTKQTNTQKQQKVGKGALAYANAAEPNKKYRIKGGLLS